MVIAKLPLFRSRAGLAKIQGSMVTKTLGPLHFEDLEPHRFEDLVRNLLYDFRDWQSLEPTGRSGSDDGYDARGFERVPLNHAADEMDFEQTELEVLSTPTLATRVWMIQCKREKQLGPSAIRRIINDTIPDEEPPYGFLFVAPVNFSKKSYDAFRDALTAKGVSDFSLWGNAEIEDMLLLPKNDRILFAFMGVSLATRRRSRTTQVRTTVTMKNKLIRILGEPSGSFLKPVLIRDIDDEAYPHEEDVADFATFPKWQEHLVIRMQAQGLVIKAHEHYAYVNHKTKEYDVIEAVDLVNRQHSHSLSQPGADDWQFRKRARSFFELLPQRHRALFSVLGLVRFDNLLLVDEKGDSEHEIPHLYLDMELGHGVKERYGPFNGKALLLKPESGKDFDVRKEGYKRCKYFPEVFPEEKPHNKISDRKLKVGQDLRWRLRQEATILFDDGQSLGPLEELDVIEVEGLKEDQGSGTSWVEVVSVETMTAKCAKSIFDLTAQDLQTNFGKKPRNEDSVRAIEIRSIYEYSIRGASGVAVENDHLD